MMLDVPCWNWNLGLAGSEGQEQIAGTKNARKR